MTSPETLEFVLWILREAFACPNRCVSVVGERQPRVALLLLEHMHKKTRGKMQSSIDETTKFILDQARAAETANSQSVLSDFVNRLELRCLELRWTWRKLLTMRSRCLLFAVMVWSLGTQTHLSG